MTVVVAALIGVLCHLYADDNSDNSKNDKGEDETNPSLLAVCNRRQTRFLSMPLTGEATCQNKFITKPNFLTLYPCHSRPALSFLQL